MFGVYLSNFIVVPLYSNLRQLILVQYFSYIRFILYIENSEAYKKSFLYDFSIRS
jgi:hypothetical protein